MTVIAASSGGSFIVFILIGFVFLYLLFVRPQRKRQSQQQQMLNELAVGDEVLTAGGIYGTVTALDENEVTVEIAPQLEVRVARRAIAGVTTEPDEAEEAEETDEESEESGEEARETEESEHSEEPETTAASPEAADDSTGAISGREAPVEDDRG